MSVVNVKLSWKEDRATEQWDSWTGNAVRSLYRKYTVLTNSAADDEPLIVDADDGTTAIPAYGDAYDGVTETPYLVLTAKDPVRKSITLWEVGVTYTQVNVQNPTSILPDIAYGFVESNEPVNFDALDQPLVNVNGEFIDPPLTRPIADFAFSITRNEAVANAALLAAYRNAINSDVFYGFVPGTVLCTKPEARNVKDSFAIYWRVTYRFILRETYPYWQYRYLNTGYQVKNTEGNLVRATDDEGNVTNQPVLLAADGTQLATGGTPVYITRPKYPAKPFSVLAL